MKSYTYGTTPEDIIREALPHKYNMELNKNDMVKLLTILDYATTMEPDGSVSFRTSILSTIGIEEI